MRSFTLDHNSFEDLLSWLHYQSIEVTISNFDLPHLLKNKGRLSREGVEMGSRWWKERNCHKLDVACLCEQNRSAMVARKWYDPKVVKLDFHIKHNIKYSFLLPKNLVLSVPPLTNHSVSIGWFDEPDQSL